MMQWFYSPKETWAGWKEVNSKQTVSKWWPATGFNLNSQLWRTFSYFNDKWRIFLLNLIKHTISVFPHEQPEKVAWAGCLDLKFSVLIHRQNRQRTEQPPSTACSCGFLGHWGQRQDAFLPRLMENTGFSLPVVWDKTRHKAIPPPINNTPWEVDKWSQRFSTRREITLGMDAPRDKGQSSMTAQPVATGSLKALVFWHRCPYWAQVLC